MLKNKNIWKVFKLASVQLIFDILLSLITGEIVDFGLFAGLGIIFVGVYILKKKMEIIEGIIFIIFGLVITIITLRNIAISVKNQKHNDSHP